MLLYYITDRQQFPGTEAEKRARLLAKIAEAARWGVDYIQLREKDLPARDLEALALAAVQAARKEALARRPTTGELTTGHRPPATGVLVNSRADVALAAGADGVHLRSDDIPAGDARALAASVLSRSPQLADRNFLIAVSCHSLAEVLLAESHGADFVVYGPVFGKGKARDTGIASLRAVCSRARIPVLALGGITLENAEACRKAGAAGIAGIRLFQENEIAAVVRQLGAQAAATKERRA